MVKPDETAGDYYCHFKREWIYTHIYPYGCVVDKPRTIHGILRSISGTFTILMAFSVAEMIKYIQ